MEDSNKVKQFIKEHQAELLVVGLSGFAILVMLLMYYSAYKQGCKDGFKAGVHGGFYATMDWFDKEFPGTNLKELWKNWSALHPEQVVY